MSDVTILFLLYGVGILMLVAEIFIPSYGILSFAGVALLLSGIIKTFSYAGESAGIAAIFACMIFLPTLAYVAVKYWHRTPLGRRIAPPNPIVTSHDTSIPVEELSGLIGRTGRCMTPLRPVGICEFDGKRVSCIAEFGMVNAGTSVEGVRISGSNLAVVEKTG